MLKPIFVDTSAFIAMGNKRDFFHVAAIKAKEKLKQERIAPLFLRKLVLDIPVSSKRQKNTRRLNVCDA